MSMVMAGVQGGEFLSVVSSAGVVRIWETRRACSQMACGVGRAERMAAENALFARELKEFGEEEANRRASARDGDWKLSEIYGHGHAPLWRVVSGLMPGMDWERLHPNERGGRLTALLRAVEKVVRYEWRAFERTNVQGRMSKVQSYDGTAEGESQKSAGGVDDPRVRWWDPMRLVCEHFGIAYSMLSRVAREVSGLSASDLTDRVKAEVIRKRMREDVKA